MATPILTTQLQGSWKMNQQHLDYFLLNFLTVIFFALSYTLSSYFFVASIFCLMIIAQNTFAGGNACTKTNQHQNSVLRIIEEQPMPESPRSFASYQKLKQRFYEHRRSLPSMASRHVAHRDHKSQYS